MIKGQKLDKFFLGLILTILIAGILMFISASLGILASNESKFYSVIFTQLSLGLVGGLIALFVTSRIPYKWFRRHSFILFLATIILTTLVFVPGLGFSHGGASRWIDLRIFSFQPAEFLKIGFVLYFAGWLSWAKQKAASFKFGILPLMIILAIVAGVLLFQPDTKSFLLLVVTGLGMLFASGLPMKYLAYLGGLLVVVSVALIIFSPYRLSRLETYIHPTRDTLGSSYQLDQSLIAIGSGGLTGRGYGQSIQKFNYLPEPQGDSIFAVIAEEFGFIGGILIILLYVAFALRGMRIATRAPDQFARLYTIGIVILITFQSLWNIGSLVGVLPLTGVPLVFVSQGGTSLLVSLAAVGIILNISKSQKAS